MGRWRRLHRRREHRWSVLVAASLIVVASGCGPSESLTGREESWREAAELFEQAMVDRGLRTTEATVDGEGLNAPPRYLAGSVAYAGSMVQFEAALAASARSTGASIRCFDADRQSILRYLGLPTDHGGGPSRQCLITRDADASGIVVAAQLAESDDVSARYTIGPESGPLPAA